MGRATCTAGSCSHRHGGAQQPDPTRRRRPRRFSADVPDAVLILEALSLPPRAHVLSAERRRGLGTVAAYAGPALLAAIAVQTWFRQGGGLASGDLAPPVAPSDEYRSHWN